VTDEAQRRARGKTYYEVLGVPRGASIDHIKSSYRLLSTKSDITEEAYRVLTDPALRRQYDWGMENTGEATHTPCEMHETFYPDCPYCRGVDYGQGVREWQVAWDRKNHHLGWHVIGDGDVGWELEGFQGHGVWLHVPDSVELRGPFFSRIEAEEHAERLNKGGVKPKYPGC
jgi:hypothetical protein